MTLRAIITLISLMSTIALAHEANLGTLLATISQVETGDRDYAIGKNGEVSRYQILPSVWLKYTPERHVKQADTVNPRKSAKVAERILTDRVSKFRLLRSRNPTASEIYALWHRPEEAYRGQLKPTTKLRAARFENLYLALLLENNSKKGLK